MIKKKNESNKKKKNKKNPETIIEHKELFTYRKRERERGGLR